MKTKGRANKRKKNKMFGKKILLSLADESYERIVADAGKISMSVSAYIRDILESWGLTRTAAQMKSTASGYEMKKAIDGLQRTLETVEMSLARLEAEVSQMKSLTSKKARQ